MDVSLRGLVEETEATIKVAIRRHTGQDEISMIDVRRLGAMRAYPDGTEVFSYDGVDLVAFQPLEVKYDTTLAGTTVRLSRKHRLLLPDES